MRRPYVRMLVHVVWATWDRAPLLDRDLIGPIHAAIAEQARKLGCDPVHVGGVSDHVHVLVGLPPTLAVADLVRRLKGASSHLVNHGLAPGIGFRWQGAYSAFSVGRDGYERARDYVGRQPAHHARDQVDPDWEISAQPESGDGSAS